MRGCSDRGTPTLTPAISLPGRGRILAALLAALLAPLALAGCSPETEGAPCAGLGSRDACPDGQACGANGRCTARVPACLACTIGESRCRADGAGRELCQADGPCTAFAPSAADARCTQGGSFCDGNALVVCPLDANQCRTFEAAISCGDHGTCAGDAPAAACVCQASPCTDSGPACRADRGAVLSCALDGPCAYAAGEAACAAGQVCGDAAPTCVARYAVALTSPVAGALLRGGEVSVTAQVTLASADAAAVPVPDVVVVTPSVGAPFTLALTGAPGATAGRTASYAGTWGLPAGDAQPVTLTAAAGAGADLATSPSLSVTVDTQAPALGTPTVTCSATSSGPAVAPCPRDGVLTVSATAADGQLAVVVVALDLDGGGHAVQLSNHGSGDVYTGQLALQAWPFEFFAHDVTATVIAADRAGNGAERSAVVPGVTRLRWTFDAGAAVTSPAVLRDGTLVVGVASTSQQLRAVTPDGTEAWRLTLGAAAVRSAPSAGALLWIGAEDGSLYAASAAGELLGTGPCAGSAPSGAVFTPAVVNGAVEVAYAGTANAEVIAAKSSGGAPTCNLNAASDSLGVATPISAAGVLVGGRFVVPTAQTASRAWVQPFTPGASNPVVLSRQATGTLATRVEVPPAASADGQVLLATSGGDLVRSSPASAADQTAVLATLGAAAATSAPVVDALGDAFVGASDRRVHRFTVPAGSATASDLWASGPTLPAAPSGLALVAQDPSGVFLLATAGNAVVALKEVGGLPVQVWPASGEPALATGALSFPVVAPPPVGSPASRLPTLYAGSSDGKLYAVVVDTGLDATSPWPKAHHDLRNTGNAAEPSP